MKGSECCFVHNPDPSVVSRLAAARSAGGKTHKGRGDTIENAIEDASFVLAHLKQQLASQFKISTEEAKVVTELLNAIVYAKESKILQDRKRHAKTKTTKAAPKPGGAS